MSLLLPFRALRPVPSAAADIAAVPYDVVTTDEARSLAEGNGLSFLRVSRAEIELPPSTDPYADSVYDRAARNFASLKESSMVVEPTPTVYLYRLRVGSHEQTGLAACFSLDEYDRDVIKKHERTRRDKEDDRTRHMIALGAQTGPVFLVYRSTADIAAIVTEAVRAQPLMDFTAVDRVQHTIWALSDAHRDALIRHFDRVSCLYIADGHHRAASAARARDELRKNGHGRSLGDGADCTSMLGVAFPHDQVRILPCNRTVRNLGGLDDERFLPEIGERFTVAPGPATPAARGDIAMYFRGRWQTLRPRAKANAADAIASLDVSVLQESLLAPILKIADIRTDKRIDFVGGARGTAALEQAVDSGRAAVAFSLFPVSVTDLMSVSDAGAIMPPKSTWFEPKLRDGLLIHVI